MTESSDTVVKERVRVDPTMIESGGLIDGKMTVLKSVMPLPKSEFTWLSKDEKTTIPANSVFMIAGKDGASTDYIFANENMKICGPGVYSMETLPEFRRALRRTRLHRAGSLAFVGAILAIPGLIAIKNAAPGAGLAMLSLGALCVLLIAMLRLDGYRPITSARRRLLDVPPSHRSRGWCHGSSSPQGGSDREAR